MQRPVIFMLGEAILTAFLQSLNLPENVIQHDVHRLEHHLSKETFEQLKRFVQTHGEPSPSSIQIGLKLP